MADNPFLPLSFIAGPAVLTNATAVLLNGASIRYNLAIGLWRDLQAERLDETSATATPYADHILALHLANQRVRLIVTALVALYAAVGGFGVSTLTGLGGALLGGGGMEPLVDLAKVATVAAGAFAMACILVAAGAFTLESRCTFRLLRLGMPPRSAAERAEAESPSGV